LFLDVIAVVRQFGNVYNGYVAAKQPIARLFAIITFLKRYSNEKNRGQKGN